MRHTKKNRRYLYKYGLFNARKSIKIIIKLFLLAILACVASPFLPIGLSFCILCLIFFRKKSN